ncbi:GNAT family N-acetyltransferase [Aliiglaciecola sp. CAU 1673]|uniref:GNAT family N-acetyltransferase n=1 Tax=Aliiglaciecola sp. CAU 1673 TaxID=3032595 RepID=UPI0023D9D377|nr:GNAT family N-acetyltransferase [Aliiglaciecola sp. CAU 1673]MDF2176810.1 GNAT family N-acetyltransferase [Aliiglaciecola sp. CAU 1673]
MTTLFVRQATRQDIPAMSAIRMAVKENQLSDPNKVTMQMYEDYLEKLGRGWVCEVDGLVVGFAYLNLTDDSVWALFVSPQYEGRGVGRQLMDTLLAYSRDNNIGGLSLSTGANTRADAFYQAQGWQRGDMLDDGEVCFSLAL